MMVPVFLIVLSGDWPVGMGNLFFSSLASVKISTERKAAYERYSYDASMHHTKWSQLPPDGTRHTPSLISSKVVASYTLPSSFDVRSTFPIFVSGTFPLFPQSYKCAFQRARKKGCSKIFFAFASSLWMFRVRPRPIKRRDINVLCSDPKVVGVCPFKV